eukprot:5004469-Pleurochrysis_carterae.AAC.9
MGAHLSSPAHHPPIQRLPRCDSGGGRVPCCAWGVFGCHTRSSQDVKGCEYGFTHCLTDRATATGARPEHDAFPALLVRGARLGQREPT